MFGTIFTPLVGRDLKWRAPASVGSQRRGGRIAIHSLGGTLNNYEAPSITELGSVEGLTRASGSDHAWDSNLPGLFGLVGFLGNGGSSDNPNVS